MLLGVSRDIMIVPFSRYRFNERRICGVLNTIVTALILFYTLSLTQPLPNLDDVLAQRLAAVPSGSPSYFREVGRSADDISAIIYAEVVDRATDLPYPGVIDWIIGINQNGTWRVFLPGDAGYTDAQNDLTPNVLLAADSSPYKPFADPTYYPDTPYHLPFEDGAYGTVVRSYNRHGAGAIDLDLNGGAITAAKDGVIIYAGDIYDLNAYSTGAWWYWNVIIILHAPFEYSLYGHIEAGSIPDWIKAGCTDDLSAPNCYVPVRAGDVIAVEGNSGYSRAPHLHVEFGQAYAIAAYMDTADYDRDGIRIEPIYSAFVYREQNVAISGYSAGEVADWRRGKLVQAVHDPLPANNRTVIGNGDFTGGTASWTPSGWINWQVSSGVMRATRLISSEQPDWGGFFQPLSGGVWANTTFDINVRLGNDSGINKTVRIGLVNGADGVWEQIEIPAFAPLQPHNFALTVPDSWAEPRLMITVNPADSSPAALIDDISVIQRP